MLMVSTKTDGYLDLLDMFKKICHLVGFYGEKAQNLHTCLILSGCNSTRHSATVTQTSVFMKFTNADRGWSYFFLGGVPPQIPLANCSLGH